MSHQVYMAFNSLCQRWLSEVKASGTLINRNSLSKSFKNPLFFETAPSAVVCFEQAIVKNNCKKYFREDLCL